MNAFHARVKASFAPDHHDRDFHLFLVVGVLAGFAGGIYNTVFNNFLNDAYQLSSTARGVVEFPRELPGMLIFIVLALLSFLGDVRLSALGMLAAALGALGLGILSPTFALMLVWMMMFSLGTHITMPLTPSIGMALSKPDEYGARLSRYSAYSLSATIVSFAVVWVGFRYLAMTYTTAFLLVAVFYVAAAFMLTVMKPNRPEKTKVRLFLHRRYTLYYFLSIVNGARKQIFLTFAPWVLIQVFHLDPPVFAILGVVVAFISIVTRRIVGRAIDVLGERIVLSAEAVFLVVLCMGYAFSEKLFPASIALIVIAVCFILDNATSSVDMARSTYVRRIAPDASEVTPTLSAGLSLDHVVSMTIPIAGGLLWAAAGYQAVFMAAAVIGVLNFTLSMFMKSKAQLASLHEVESDPGLS